MKTIRIGLDKVDALYNYLVELIIAQMTFRQRGDDVIKTKPLCKTTKGAQGRYSCGYEYTGPGDKKSREDITGAITWKNFL